MLCWLTGGRFKKEVILDGQSYLLLIRDEGGAPEMQVPHLPHTHLYHDYKYIWRSLCWLTIFLYRIWLGQIWLGNIFKIIYVIFICPKPCCSLHTFQSEIHIVKCVTCSAYQFLSSNLGWLSEKTTNFLKGLKRIMIDLFCLVQDFLHCNVNF